MTICRWHPDDEFHTPERCYITELQNKDTDPACSIARARVLPGVTTRLHALRGTTERYVILAGQGAVEIDGSGPVTVSPFDIVNIPSGISQRITNTGSSDLIFLCICTPRFQRENYLDLENQ